MKNLKMYEPQDKMITLIKDNYNLLQALGSFGINLGFGDKTVAETCLINGVDTYTFLAVVNYTSTTSPIMRMTNSFPSLPCSTILRPATPTIWISSYPSSDVS